MRCTKIVKKSNNLARASSPVSIIAQASGLRKLNAIKLQTKTFNNR